LKQRLLCPMDYGGHLCRQQVFGTRPEILDNLPPYQRRRDLHRADGRRSRCRVEEEHRQDLQAGTTRSSTGALGDSYRRRPLGWA
jgi:hypothetical protein